MENIRISIIIPVYNGEKYLPPLLDSIVEQREQRYEVIVIDDGSTDRSVSILNSYQEKIRNLRVISQKNSGVSVARNRGIAEARGEYFCFVDADDVLASYYLNVFVAAIERYHPDMGVCGYQMFYGNMPFVLECNKKPEMTDFVPIHGTETFAALTQLGLQTQIGNKFYKTSLVKENEIGLIPGHGYGEDMFFNWKVVLAAQSLIKINCDMYFYRMIEGSASVRYHPHLYENYKREYEDLISFAKKNGYFNSSFWDAICRNIIARIPALTRMAVRRKAGIAQAVKDIRCIVRDDMMRSAAQYVVGHPENSEPMEMKLSEQIVNEKVWSLWFEGFKSEMRVILGRKIKNMRSR